MVQLLPWLLEVFFRFCSFICTTDHSIPLLTSCGIRYESANLLLHVLVFVLEQPNTESTDTSIDKNDEITGINQTENIQDFTKKLPEDIGGRHLPSQSQNETDVWNFLKSFVSTYIYQNISQNKYHINALLVSTFKNMAI